ncbi:hypothetical protein Xhom_03554 [Xenorhabdus hominickii]|uniref:Uncharacterized protein n=1 Tax=Xenorhabdus hominickii TaxID=351679 RepID=A0A2G0Q2X4_XENHO|nr:hypothetical protein Xhom_03554 [Xenorhabdus hominickii]
MPHPFTTVARINNFIEYERNRRRRWSRNHHMNELFYSGLEATVVNPHDCYPRLYLTHDIDGNLMVLIYVHSLGRD